MSNTPPTTSAAEETTTPKPQREKTAKPKSASAKTGKVVKPKATVKPKAEPKTKVKPKAKAKAKVNAKAADTAPNKTAKVKKPKLVRDSFTMPKDEYAAIQTLKTRSVALAQPAKKSELLRAGIKLLAGLSDKALLTALKAVPTLKTGRPAKG